MPVSSTLYRNGLALMIDNVVHIKRNVEKRYRGDKVILVDDETGDILLFNGLNFIFVLEVKRYLHPKFAV